MCWNIFHDPEAQRHRPSVCNKSPQSHGNRKSTPLAVEATKVYTDTKLRKKKKKKKPISTSKNTQSVNLDKEGFFNYGN